MDLKTFKTTLKSLPVIRTSWKTVRVLLQPLWAVVNCARFSVTAPNSVFTADKTIGSFYRFQRQLASDRLGWFCPKPFDHLYAHTDGTWKPCVDAFTVPKTQVWDFTIKSHGPFDYFMSADMGRLRGEMIEGKLGIAESICAACTSRERIGLTSPRQKRLQAITTKDPQRLFNLYRSLASADSSERYRPRGRIISVALRIFGNNCNLKCYMCHPYNSSSRTRELRSIDEDYHTDWLHTFDPEADTREALVHPDWAVDRTVADIIRRIPLIYSIHITGGEPLIIAKQYEVLDAIIETGQASQIKLAYTTNLTKLSHRGRSFLEYAVQFREVQLAVSIDGIGAKGEYIRYGSKWDQIVANLEQVMAVDNVRIAIHSATSLLNVLDAEEIASHFWVNSRLPVSFGAIRGPDFLCVKHLPEELKEPLIVRYQQFPDRYQRIIETLKEQRNEVAFKRFLQYLDALDRARGTDFLTLWPQFRPYAETAAN